ncbi:LysR family transcriptional regulator [Raoultella ornithinolytica]|uniref:LysR family transcriptional regulator n=1 Tax=Raoultella ornithinolytica TaxID=54291 RepID=UPI002DBE65A3|nr:LysR family transcriptional regulator [Raoultella ornithinolytica]MEB7859418.1 LysR family transcriptional regulator [Raoultella ornithinolytica]MEB7981174.1 LysR family transcriptional regulator [Raoultella ornithinolytica]
MNHATLLIFKIVAEEQSITRAAKKLGRVQSNITTRIQQLEEELDVELFVRGNKKMVLSSAGKQFLDYALRILSLGEEAKQALHPTNPAGRLRLGAMEATAASRLIHLLPRFRANCPQVELTLHTQPTQQLTDLVQRAALDCALVSLPVTAEGELVRPTDIDAIPVFDEQLMLVSPEGPADIRLAAFPRGCSYRAIAEAFFASDAHIEIQDVGSYHAMIACIASGGYRGILPQSVIDILPLPDNCQIQPLKQVQTQLIWRRESMSPALSEMRQLLTVGIQF